VEKGRGAVLVSEKVAEKVTAISLSLGVLD